MQTDLNDVDALIENLVDAFRKAVIKGVRVRVDENGEMIATHNGIDLVRVLPTGTVFSEADLKQADEDERGIRMREREVLLEQEEDKTP